MAKIETLRQILKLASDESAPEGERNAAQERLVFLLDKYGLSLSDVAEAQTQTYQFAYTTAMERTILFQIYFRVTGLHSAVYGKGSRKVHLEMSESEHTEVERLYNHYRKLWQKQLCDFENAWLSKQDLLGEPREDADASCVVSLSDLARDFSDSIRKESLPLVKLDSGEMPLLMA